MPSSSALLLYFAVASVESVSVEKESIPNAWPLEFAAHNVAHVQTQRREELANQGIMRKAALSEAEQVPTAAEQVPTAAEQVPIEALTPAPTVGLTPAEQALHDGACSLLTWTKGTDDYMCSEGATKALTLRMDGKDHGIVKHGSVCTVVCKSSFHSPDPEVLTCSKHKWLTDAGETPEIVCAPSRTMLLFGVFIVMVCCGGLAFYVHQSRKSPAPWGHGPGMQHGLHGHHGQGMHPGMHPGQGHGAPGYQPHHPPYGGTPSMQYGGAPPPAGAAPQYAGAPLAGEQASHGGAYGGPQYGGAPPPAGAAQQYAGAPPGGADASHGGPQQ